MTQLPTARSWAEINLDNIAGNYRAFCRHTQKNGRKPEVMCVVKANAYGHGSAAVAKKLEAAGCGWFGVATANEAFELRNAGVRGKILVFNHIEESKIEAAAEADIALTVYSREMAAGISVAAKKPVDVHIKADTGLNRVGFAHDSADGIDSIMEAAALPNIRVEGLFTHFASSYEADASYTGLQTERLSALAKALGDRGLRPGFLHAANSAAAIAHPRAHFDMVRIGISLYGCRPSPQMDMGGLAIKPCMELKTQIYRLARLAPGQPVSYGGLFVTKRPSLVATMPIGYADGVSGALTGKLEVLVNGQRAPVVGKICMDQCMADVTDIKGEISLHDEVVVFGGQNGGFIPVEQPAAQMGIINYEMLCKVSARVPRVYV